MPLRAASAVRTLARTETFMPMKPVAPESTAPSAKPTAVFSAEENADQYRQHDAGDGDGRVLLLQIGGGAFLDRGCDFTHPLIAGGPGQYPLD